MRGHTSGQIYTFSMIERLCSPEPEYETNKVERKPMTIDTQNTNWKPDLCIHHFPCDDGFAAAWVVWKKWGDDVSFHGMTYGEELPDVSGKNVLFVDFSVNLDVMEQLAEKAKSIVILDHHKTAKAALAPLCTPDYYMPFTYQTVRRTASEVRDCNTTDWFVIAQFDDGACGARLAWHFCFPDEEVPDFIRYIEDRDLWHMSMKGTRRFSLGLRSYSYSFPVWERLSKKTEMLIDEGKIIERFYDKKVREVCKGATYQIIAGHLVLVANAPHFMASDVAHELLKQDTDMAFAACYYDTKHVRTYSLCSEDDRQDVSEIAKQYGGGGHRNAAGFSR